MLYAKHTFGDDRLQLFACILFRSIHLANTSSDVGQIWHMLPAATPWRELQLIKPESYEASGAKIWFRKLALVF